MVLDGRSQASPRPPLGRRRIIRRITAGLALGVAVLYLVLLVLVSDAEAGLGENTFGAYLFLSVPYLVGGVLLARLDSRPLYLLGAVVQVAVIVLFVLFGVGSVDHPGVFAYEALARLNMPVWATLITGAEVALLGLLSYLAATAPTGTAPSRRSRSDSGGPSPRSATGPPPG